MQGFVPDMQRYVHNVPTAGGRYVTANGALWPLFDVLFANPARLASLTGQQRGWLRQAAQQAGARSVNLVAGQNGPYIRQACAMGARFATRRTWPPCARRSPPSTAAWKPTRRPRRSSARSSS